MSEEVAIERVTMEIIGDTTAACDSLAEYWQGYIGMEMGVKLHPFYREWNTRVERPGQVTLKVGWAVTNEPYWPRTTQLAESSSDS